MSDATLDPKPAEPEAPEKLDFERADFAEPAAKHVPCSACQAAITTAYYQLLDKVLCASCRDAVNRTSEQARSGAAFGKAFLVAGGVALGCGLLYALFVHLTSIQLALATIGIGWVVGRMVQQVTRGFGSMKHQILAVAFTYLASAMGYLPVVLDAMKPGEGESGGALVFVLRVVFISLVTLAAPILDVTSGFSGVLGALIMFFGMRTAWQVSRGIGGPVAISGPYQVSAAP